MDTSESEYGLTLTLHSEASRDIYLNNKPSSFTNLLKVPIKLDQNEFYEVSLSNIHIPAYQSYLLKRVDRRRNDIKFHVGMFVYDEQTANWKLLENSKIDLWTYCLNKDVSGLESDNDISRDDFIKRFNDSFNIKDKDAFLSRKKCLSLFNIFARHKYEEGHTNKSLVSECPKCSTLMNTGDGSADIATNQDRLGITIGDGQPHIDFFENYDLSRKNHIWLKNLEDLHPSEKYFIFDHFFKFFDIDIYTYLRDVIHKNKANISKSQARRIINRVKDKNGKYFTNFQNIFTHDSYKNVWGHSKLTPQLVLYTTFGDKMCDYLSVDRDREIVITTCGNENMFSMYRDNAILTPKFNKQKINSLFIYSDLVSKSIRFGDHLTNLLGIITLNSDFYSKPAPSAIYRPLAHNHFSSLSVKIKDSNGDDPNFKPGTYAALEIIIRKRKP